MTALGIVRTITDKQITWLVEREEFLENANLQPLPENYDLGGISGGPLICVLESENYVAHHALAGILIEHPNYGENEFNIERVIAIRADFISATGRIANAG